MGSDGRSRDGIVRRNVLAALLLKGGSLAAGLVTIPAYLRYFNDQQVLGVWFTLVATLSWILNFDVGLGNGVRNRLASALSTGDLSLSRTIISSAYFATSWIVLALGCAVVLIVFFADWNLIMNIPTSSVGPDGLRMAVGILFAGLLFQLLLRTIASVLYALQASAIVSLMSFVTTLSMLAYAGLASPANGDDGLLGLSVIFAIATNSPLLIVTVIVFGWRLKGVRPSLRCYSGQVTRDVMGLGLRFFSLQVLYMLLANSNPILISWLADPSDVVDFQIYSRPFSAVSSVFILALAPIWSAVTQAATLGDVDWIARTYVRLQWAAGILVIALLGLVPLMQTFVDLWLGARSIEISFLYAAVFAISAGAFAWSGVLSSVANGTGRLRGQFVGFFVGVLLKGLFAVVAVGLTGSWVWVVASDIVGLLPFLVIQPFLLHHYVGQPRASDGRGCDDD